METSRETKMPAPPVAAPGLGHPPPYVVPPGPPVVGVNVIAGGTRGLVITQQMGPKPTRMICKNCNKEIVTKTKSKPSIRTHLLATFFCATLLWPCVCIPYCVESCMNVEHTCPNCEEYVGTHFN